jgi:hypothetical protein
MHNAMNRGDVGATFARNGLLERFANLRFLGA